MSADDVIARAAAPTMSVRATTPCCDCGNERGVPWVEDDRRPVCVECGHVCAHNFDDPRPKRQPFRWVTAVTR